MQLTQNKPGLRSQVLPFAIFLNLLRQYLHLLFVVIVVVLNLFATCVVTCLSYGKLLSDAGSLSCVQ